MQLLGSEKLFRSNAERKHVLRLVPKLAGNAQVYPRKYDLTGVECEVDQPVDGGGYGSIYKGTYNGQIVCVKAVRMYQTGAKMTDLKVRNMLS